MKRVFLSVGLLSVLLTGCVEGTTAEDYEKQVAEQSKPKEEKAKETSSKPSATLPDYEIKNKRLGKVNDFYIDFVTDSTDQAELKLLCRHAASIEKKANAVYVRIWNNDGVIATGRMAVTNKGLALTGLDKIGKLDFEMNEE